MTIVISESRLFGDGIVLWAAVTQRRVARVDSEATIAARWNMTARTIIIRQAKRVEGG